ncbi:MAG TPA: response regulator [Methylomirabilota bacterium]|nr:response regulator [Methylomirabilota bacterium]
MARILVIDDEGEIRAILQDTLEAAGYEVRVAGDGNEGLAIQQEWAADLVITDIFMPDKEGIETIIELQERYPGTRIIAMSGGGALRTLDYLSSAEHFGAIRTISKPFDCEALIATVRDILAR